MAKAAPKNTMGQICVNTAVALLALIVSTISALFSWWTYELKDESVGFSSLIDFNCNIEFQRIGDHGILGLCWTLTISNQSDSTISLVSHQAFSELKQGLVFYSGFNEMEDGKGNPLSSPIVLNSGVSQSYLVRGAVEIPKSVVEVIDKLPAAGNGLQMVDLKNAAANAELDVIGNHIDIKTYAGGGAQMTWGLGYQTAIVLMKFESGRGHMFVAQLAFPPLLQ
jgi:hypothetical protein